MNTCNFNSSCNTAHYSENYYCDTNNTTSTTVNFNDHRIATKAKNTEYLASTSNEHTPVVTEQELESRSVKTSNTGATVKNFNNNKNTDFSLPVDIFDDNLSPIKILEGQITAQLSSSIAKVKSFTQILQTAKYRLYASLAVPVTSLIFSITVSALFLLPLFLLPIPMVSNVFSNLALDVANENELIAHNMSLQFLKNIFNNYTKLDNNIELSYEELLTSLTEALKSEEIVISQYVTLSKLFIYFIYNDYYDNSKEQDVAENQIKSSAENFYELLFAKLETTFKRANFDITELSKAKTEYLASLTIEDIFQFFKIDKTELNSKNNEKLKQALLGLSLTNKTRIKDLSEQIIKQAFKKQALTTHPDKNPNNPKANEEFRELEQHRQTLLNAVKNQKFE